AHPCREQGSGHRAVLCAQTLDRIDSSKTVVRHVVGEDGVWCEFMRRQKRSGCIDSRMRDRNAVPFLEQFSHGLPDAVVAFDNDYYEPVQTEAVRFGAAFF